MATCARRQFAPSSELSDAGFEIQLVMAYSGLAAGTINGVAFHVLLSHLAGFRLSPLDLACPP